MEQMAGIRPDPSCLCGGEISKMFEEFKRGLSKNWPAGINKGVKGGIVLIVAGKDYNLAREEGLHIPKSKRKVT